jgi:hypothetical protein
MFGRLPWSLGPVAREALEAAVCVARRSASDVSMGGLVDRAVGRNELGPIQP